VTAPVPHISVCICTYKRQTLLRRSLDALARQETDGRFTYSVVVVDNDRLRSAEGVTSDFAAECSFATKYCVEPRQNIALARNRAVENAEGDFVAFIDDDEFPTRRWLATLFETCLRYGVDGVLGPVKPHFDQPPPAWVVKGGFCERQTYPTGLVIDWRKGRTGNVLLRKRVLGPDSRPFDPQFVAGEDQEFFRKAIAKGCVFIWCDEAVAFEVIPPYRWSRAFMLKKALLSGTLEPLLPTFGPRVIVKSAVAVAAYAVGLPFALALGQHRFMKCLVKLFDHLGKLLGLVGVRPFTQYVTE